MTFLTPLPAIIAAAITVPALIAMYLLKLRRKPVRVSSTMLWDRAVQDLQANVPFRWLRPSWLLLLHLLILAALLLALARPAIDAGLSAAERVFLVIDRTASMRTAHPEGGTRFDRALADARTFLDDLESNGFAGSVTLIESAAAASIVEGPTPDLARIRSALSALSPTDQPGALTPPLELASALAQAGADEASSAPPALVAVFSDGVAPDADRLTLAGAEARYLPAAPAPEPAPNPDGERSPGIPPNLGIASLAAQRDFADPVLLRVFAQLVSTHPREVGVTLSVSIDDQPFETAAVTVPPRDPQSTQPGRRSVTFELAHAGAGVLTIALETDDALAADNRASVLLTPAQRPRALLVRPSAANRGPDWVLDDPLAELDLAALERLDAQTYNADPAAALSNIDLVIFDTVEPARVPPVPSISFGAGIDLPGLSLTPEEPAPARVVAWEREHPLMRRISMDRLTIARASTVAVEGGVVSLARSNRGTLIALADDAGTQHLVVAFDPRQSDWPLDFGFALFLARAVDTLAGRGEGGSMRALSTEETITLAPDPAADRLRVVAPDGSVAADLSREQLAGRSRVPIGRVESVGVYRVSGARSPAFAVALLSELESTGMPRSTIDVGGRAVSARSGTESRPTEVWYWFILAAAVLLALEWLVYALRMRV